MDSRKIILLVGALVVAAITAFMARTLLIGSSTPTAQAAAMPEAAPDAPKVLVATRALPVGTILDATAFKFTPWPKDLVQDAYYVQGADDMAGLQGTVVRTAITAGTPMTKGSLVKPGDRGFLAAALTPGMRAVTIPVSTQNAVAGFVFPGDRVDLVLTQTVPGGGDGSPLKVAETIIRNLRVLATDQRTSQDKDDTGNTVVRTFSNVTIEATPKIAEDLSVAQTLGTLSLSLRPLANDTAELADAVAHGDVKVAATADGKTVHDMVLDAAAQPIAGKSTFSTGADVSRFQRSTVPGKPAAGGDTQSQQPGGAPGQTVPVQGPVVRVARGNTVIDVPVGGKK